MFFILLMYPLSAVKTHQSNPTKNTKNTTNEKMRYPSTPSTFAKNCFIVLFDYAAVNYCGIANRSRLINYLQYFVF